MSLMESLERLRKIAEGSPLMNLADPLEALAQLRHGEDQAECEPPLPKLHKSSMEAMIRYRGETCEAASREFAKFKR